MKMESGLKRLYLCITNENIFRDVDKIIHDIKKNIQGSMFEKKLEVVPVDTAGAAALSDENRRDYLLAGDCDISGSQSVDIGLGKNYIGNARYVIYEACDIDEDYLNLVWARINHEPLIVAQNAELLIREMTLDDLDGMYEMYDSLKDCPYIEQLYERGREEEFSKNYIDNMYAFFGYGLWLAFLKKTGQMVARIGIENREIDGETVQELGYLVDKRFQGRHIAFDGCELVLNYAKDVIGLDNIYTCVDKNNNASIALAHKLGFKEYANDIEGMNIYIKDLK